MQVKKYLARSVREYKMTLKVRIYNFLTNLILSLFFVYLKKFFLFKTIFYEENIFFSIHTSFLFNWDFS